MENNNTERVAVVVGKLRSEKSPSMLEQVSAYLPRNYTASEFGGRIFIKGIDDHGWTLDGYVIPRLGSALISAREIQTEG